MKIEWKKHERVWGEEAWLGRVVVGEAYHDGTRSKGDPAKCAAVCKLPGIKTHLGHFVEIEEAKRRVETAVDFWLTRAGLK